MYSSSQLEEARRRTLGARDERSKVLDLSDLGLDRLPQEVLGCTELEVLDISGNQLESLQDEIGNLNGLVGLLAADNRLTRLPPSLSRLKRLEVLDVAHNALRTLPEELLGLSGLRSFDLRGNPLDVELRVLESGAQNILAFLRERERGRERYEAKLILLGHGGAGKTCLSRALRDEPFAHQVRTRGVNVDPWTFANPKAARDESKRITLSLWDFEGQEISHQSHQFFLARRSIYLVVFNGREDARLDRLGYWLDTIRARAPGCSALLVATQCEDTEPRVDIEALREQYGRMLPDQPLVVTGCVTGRGLDELRSKLASLAANLEHVPRRWPAAYDRAELALRQLSSSVTSLTHSSLQTILDDAGVKGDDHDMVAELLSDVGAITFFPDSYELRDFVVLRPQWLTHAISLVLDSRELAESRGEISLEWLAQLWERDNPGLFARFYACMKQFELCYPLESRPDTALVPLRFDYARPEIPWAAIPDAKERRIVYRIELRPPAGLMSRFIVKTHHLIVRTADRPKGIYWKNGVFLQLGEGELLSQALCSWDEERRTLSMVVRSAFPQKMAEQLDFVADAVFKFFQGLRATRYFGCVNADESPCRGDHSERQVAFHMKRSVPLLCDVGMHQVDPRVLLEGLHSFGRADAIREIFREEAARLEQLVGTGVDALRERMRRLEDELRVLNATAQRLPAEMSLQIRQAQRQLLHALDVERLSHVPCIFTIFPVRKHPLDVRYFFKERFVLHLYCEAELPHFSDASWEFDRPREWWMQVSPVLNLLFAYLQLLAKPALDGLRLALGDENQSALAKQISGMKDLISALPEGLAGDGRASVRGLSRGLADAEMTRARAALAELTRELDPIGFKAGAFGNLRRYRLPDNSFRWLCEKHAQSEGLSV